MKILMQHITNQTSTTLILQNKEKSIIKEVSYKKKD